MVGVAVDVQKADVLAAVALAPVSGDGGAGGEGARDGLHGGEVAALGDVGDGQQGGRGMFWKS